VRFDNNPATSRQIMEIERLGKKRGDNWVMRLTCAEANAVIRQLHMRYSWDECKNIHPGSVRDATYVEEEAK